MEHGTIVGGAIFARQAVEAKVIGSDAGTPTSISVGLSESLLEQLETYEQEQAERRATLETYKEQLAALESSARPSPKDRERMTELSFEIPEMETAMRDAEQAIGKHLPSDSQPDEAHDDDGPGNPFLFVSEHIWQGVTVRIDDRFAVFDKELKGPVKLCIKRIPGERFIIAINPTTGNKLQQWSSEVATPVASAH